MALLRLKNLLHSIVAPASKRRCSAIWGPDRAIPAHTESLESRRYLSGTSLGISQPSSESGPDVMNDSSNHQISWLGGPASTGGDGIWGGHPGGTTGGGDVNGGWGVTGDDGSTGGWGVTGGGSVNGGGATEGGGNIGGERSSTTLSVQEFDTEALEGPYTESKLDEARFRVLRTGGLFNQEFEVWFRTEGEAVAEHDYQLTDHNRAPLESVDTETDGRLYRMTFPAYTTSLDVLLVSRMDGQYEAPESATVKLIRNPEKRDIYRVTAINTFDATIIDATADLDISATSEGDWLTEQQEDTRGANLLMNNDFDAGQAVSDMKFYARDRSGFAHQEDDVLRLQVKSWIQPEHDRQQGVTHDYFSLDWTDMSLRVYRYRQSPVAGHVLWTRITPGHHFELKSEQVAAFRVEGTAAAVARLTVHWGSPRIGEQGQQLDSVNATCWDADLDIDSNNNNGLQPPERNDWEELLEDNDYGIGKIIYQQEDLPAPDGPPRNGFTPAVFHVHPRREDVRVRFRFPGLRGESGIIRVWTAPPEIPGGLIDEPVEKGGHRLTSDFLYPPEVLNQIQGLWIEALDADSAHNTFAGTQLGRPDDRISMDVLLAQKEQPLLLKTDEIRYLVVEDRDTFYPNLQFHRSERYWGDNRVHTGETLRDSLISGAVYGLEDLPEYGLELLSQSQMQTIGLHRNIINAMVALQNRDYGLKMAIYRDYLNADGPALVIAFAGTELGIYDIFADVVQGLGLSGKDWINGAKLERQYIDAMTITSRIVEALKGTFQQMRTTGHSLGGGLASAASVASDHYRLPANIFNAAGLHKNTITLRDENGNLTTAPVFRGAFERYAAEQKGQGVINHFSLQYDALTFLQRNLPALPLFGNIPTALGRQYELRGPYDQELQMRSDQLREVLRKPPQRYPYEVYRLYLLRYLSWVTTTVGTAISPGSTMASHHTIRLVHYSLMVEQKHLPLPSRQRTFDIFGFRDPDGGKP